MSVELEFPSQPFGLKLWCDQTGPNALQGAFILDFNKQSLKEKYSNLEGAQLVQINGEDASDMSHKNILKRFLKKANYSEDNPFRCTFKSAAEPQPKLNRLFSRGVDAVSEEPEPAQEVEPAAEETPASPSGYTASANSEPAPTSPSAATSAESSTEIRADGQTAGQSKWNLARAVAAGKTQTAGQTSPQTAGERPGAGRCPRTPSEMQPPSETGTESRFWGEGGNVHGKIPHINTPMPMESASNGSEVSSARNSTQLKAGLSSKQLNAKTLKPQKRRQLSAVQRKIQSIQRKIDDKASDEHIDRVFDVVDLDDNGTIDFNEFSEAMGPEGMGFNWNEARLQKAFNDFDTDGNGTIDKQEFRDLVHRDQEHQTDVSTHVTDKIKQTQVEDLAPGLRVMIKSGKFKGRIGKIKKYVKNKKKWGVLLDGPEKTKTVASALSLDIIQDETAG